jgi:hypothetical protein
MDRHNQQLRAVSNCDKGLKPAPHAGQHGYQNSNSRLNKQQLKQSPFQLIAQHP